MPRGYAWPLLTLLFLIIGGVIAIGDTLLAQRVWMAGIIITGAPVVFATVRGMFRGRFATDIVASLSIITAVAFGQPLAGLVIVLMQTGGEALERYAEGRASAAVRELEEAAPRIAHRDHNGRIDDVPVTSVAIGDVLLLRPGELVPCDGVVIDGDSDVDTSSLTGEPRPLHATSGVRVASGMANGCGSFRMRATAPASESQYARVVQLVREAQESKAPLQRLADRYAVWFTPLTILVAIAAVAFSHDRMRALAVLVVATPCPLILATPVAIIGGINRAARRFVVIRHGGALERLAAVDTVVFDKTGTLTIGKPRLVGVHVAPGFDRAEVLRAAASVEERSSHLLARVLVDAVKGEKLEIPPSRNHVETPGQGVTGVVTGLVGDEPVRVGARAFVLPCATDGIEMAAKLEREGATLRAYVSIGKRLAAVLEYGDEIRPDLSTMLASLGELGVHRFVLLSGDHAPIARALGEKIGIGEAYGDLLPEDKARFVERLQADGSVVMMVGDGVNDAPALAKADVGVALASYGAGIAAEAADVVILIDALGRTRDAIAIARRTMRIARQSIWAGLGLSGLGMLIAAAGYLPPIAGAAAQEIIDVAVILNALRTSRDPRQLPPAASRPVAERAATASPQRRKDRRGSQRTALKVKHR